jgi:carotenoid cleavage dioxygenase-like enzyme
MPTPPPPYVNGHFAPVPDETTAKDLEVLGELPAELTGHYLRNGHNPKPGVTPSHWFKGSGMLHGVRLDDGRASWYRNRWVRTPALEGAELMRADGSVDLTASVAGTHIIEHAGHLLALQEANLPFEVTRELDTIGPFDFDGRLTSAMTAHPKTDPETGELHFFSYSPFPPYLTYLVASAEGQIVRSSVVADAAPSLMHDFAITATKVVFIDMPVVFDPTETSGIPYRWHDEHPTRIGVMDRHDPDAVPTWIPADPMALLHTTNAYDNPDGSVTLEAPRYDRAAWETSWKWWIGAPGYAAAPVTGATAHRWTLDPSRVTVTETPLDDLVTEFPTINERRLGSPTDVSYAVAFPGAGLEEHAIVKLDSGRGERIVNAQGARRHAGEAVFVPAENPRSEDDGWLLTIVSDLAADASELLVLDAHDLHQQAAVRLPRRVPSGIHGSWIPDR